MTDTTAELEALAMPSENRALIDALNALHDQIDPLVEVNSDAEHVRHFLDTTGKVITIDDRDRIRGDALFPRRAHDATTVHGLEAMKALAEKWYEQDENRDTFVTYANEKALSFTTILDDDNDGIPGWRRHRLDYQLDHTPAMAAWLRLDRKMVEQAVFAEHIEDRMRDVIDPDAADLLEIAQTLSATGSVEFRSAQRLRTGQTQIKYVEETDAVGGHDGQLEIPGSFTLMLPVFVGTLAQEITARFRFRLRGGNLTLGYLLDDVARIAQESFDGLVDDFAANVDWPVVRAAAPRSR